MTRRERLEAKVERRHDWAAKAAARSNQRFAAVSKIADNIPFGQPILVGHHSEAHARRDAARIENGMSKGVELAKLADHHAAKASGLEVQLKRTIFSDDENAIEALEARIKEAENKAEKINTLNKAYRKAAKAGGTPEEVADRIFQAGACGAVLAQTMCRTMAQCRWLKSPLDATGERAAICRDRERIETIRLRQARAAKAVAAGGVVVEQLGESEYARVTFAEKPENNTIEALRSAGFRWDGGGWVGLRASVPAGVEVRS